MIRISLRRKSELTDGSFILVNFMFGDADFYKTEEFPLLDASRDRCLSGDDPELVVAIENCLHGIEHIKKLWHLWKDPEWPQFPRGLQDADYEDIEQELKKFPYLEGFMEY